jgi:hypothetical protein
MTPCNFCGDAIVFHLDGGRNRCEKCGSGFTEMRQDQCRSAPMCSNAYRDQPGVVHVERELWKLP